MSFKIKKVNKNYTNNIRKDEQFSKEKQELKKLIENIDDSSLPFSLIKIAVNNNFLPLSMESYYLKINPEIDMLRKKDGSKYCNNSINAIKSALVTNKLFEQKENKLYGLNINEAIKYLNNLKEINIKDNSQRKKSYRSKFDTFLGKKRSITKNLTVNKYEKYEHGYQILDDLLELYSKKTENRSKIKTNFNKYQSPTDLMQKTMDNDKICGMLITFKYFKPFLKKFLHSKSIFINKDKKFKINKHISDLSYDLDLVQSFIKIIASSKIIKSDN